MNGPGIGAFLDQYVRPAIDILLLAFLIYKTYEVLVKTQAIHLVKGMLLLAGIYIAAFFLRLGTVSWLLGILGPGLVIALAIVFQPELRRIFLRLGQGSLFGAGGRRRDTQFEPVIAAAELLSAKRRGALVVFSGAIGVKGIVETGTRLDALVSASLIISIFEYETPLHDGAIVIQDGRIVAAGCFLPLSEQQDIRKSFGSRHRAALGLAEQTDAVVLVVSEETGAISLAYDSRLHYGLGTAMIRTRLKTLLGVEERGFEGGGDAPQET